MKSASVVLDLDSRRTIYEFVSQTPGMHLRGVARGLSLPLGTALYHLDCLSKAGLVAVRFDGRYKRYFAVGVDRREKDYISVLHRTVPRRILQALVETPGATQRNLASRVAVSRSTLSFHLTWLVRQGLVACEDRRPENRYSVVEMDLARKVLAEQGHLFDQAAPQAPVAPVSVPVEGAEA